MNQKSTSAPIAENKMGTMPVGRLVLNMSLPLMISMPQHCTILCDKCAFIHAFRKCSDGSFHGFSIADTSDRSRCRYRCGYERTAFQIPWRKEF